MIWEIEDYRKGREPLFKKDCVYFEYRVKPTSAKKTARYAYCKKNRMYIGKCGNCSKELVMV